MDQEHVIDLAAWKKKRDKTRMAEAADWGALSRRLRAYARRCAPDHASREDLAQSAIEHFFAHLDAWEPEQRTLLEHLRSVLNGIAIDEARKGPNRRRAGEAPPEEPTVREKEPRAEGDGYEPTPRHEIDPNDAERAIADRERARKIVARLQRAFAGDAVALDVMRENMRGNDWPSLQAEALGCSLEVVLAARRRIQWRARELAAEVDAAAPSEAALEGST